MLRQTRLPSLVSIGAFEAAARHGSFARAARELGTSAASVSYHVRQLEQQLDIQLFRRSAHGVELTETGQTAADQVIAAFDMIHSSFVRTVERDHASLTISVLQTFGTSWLIPRLGQLRAEAPDLRVEVDLSMEPRDLIGGGFDAAIRNGHGKWPGMVSVFLFPSIFTPLCSPAILQEATNQDWPSHACSIPLLGRPDWWTLWFRALGHDQPKEFGLSFPEEHLDAAAAIEHHGITIGSPLLFRREIEQGRLVPAHSLVIDSGRSFWLTYPAGRRHTAKIKRFADWIESEADSERAASRDFIDRARAIDLRQ